jgi:hypothetical protein
MIILNLKGGLGNQMFQYALGYTLSLIRNDQLCFDLRLMRAHQVKPSPRNVPRDFDLDIFDIKKKLATNKDLVRTFQFFDSYRIRKYISLIFDKLNLFIFYENKRIYNERVLNKSFKNIYLDGLWQSEKYFRKFRAEILELYNFNKIIKKEKNQIFLNKIDFKKSICLNVRRTDFISNPEHNIVNVNYYKNAIINFKKIIGSKFKVYVFSDDLVWCKQNLNFIENIEFVDHYYAGYKFYDYLYLMSKFKYFVIPNSSFAWWACWLSKHNDKIVMVPYRWSGLVSEDLIDIIPHSWIRIKF